LRLFILKPEEEVGDRQKRRCKAQYLETEYLTEETKHFPALKVPR
jgi:hypothetical protein